MQLFYSIPRRSFNERGITDLQSLQADFAEGLIHGVDISGSIFESQIEVSDDDEKLGETIRNRLGELFQFCREKQLSLRIHAFEGSNSGPFYTALRESLGAIDPRSTGGALQISFGHVAQVDRSWVQALAFYQRVNPNLKLRFEANYFSNAFLQGTSRPDFIQRLRLLQEFNLAYGFGSDGRGIFPSSTILRQVDLLMEALDESSCRWDVLSPKRRRRS